MWKISLLEDSRSKLKKRVSEITDKEAVVPFLLREINRLSETITNANSVDLYTACVSALVNHERYGGLKSVQIQTITHLALDMLKAQKIDPESSRLASLAGDIYSVLSQIRRKEGLHWEAAWDAELGIRYLGDHPTEGIALRLLIAANRSLRLGSASAALQCVEEAWNANPSPKQRCLLATTQIKSLRLSGARAEAASAIEMHLSAPWMSDDTRKELEWERFNIGLVSEAGRQSVLNAMLKAIKTDNSHHHHAYALESILWCHAVANVKSVNDAPKVKNLYRRFKIDKDRYGFLYESAKVLSDCYDTDRPIAARISELGQMLAQAHVSLSVDHELLIWLGAYRWLDRIKSPRLSGLCLSRYKAWSLQLSDGRLVDALGINS